MADGAHWPILERGIATLKYWLDDGASLLKEKPPKQGEAISFDYPLPQDYMGVERTVRIIFPTDFPRFPLQIEVQPSPWLEWPHSMPNGVCLFGLRQRPASGTPEEVVDESLRRLGQLVALVMPDSDAARRQREFDTEITSYWSQQLHATLGQLMLLERPRIATSLLALTDTRQRKDTIRNSTWLAQDATCLTRYWKRVTGETRPVRTPAAAAFYLPLTSVPPVRAPASSRVLAWLEEHVSSTDFTELRKWYKESSGLPLRWLILRLPNEGLSHHFALVLRAAGMKKDGHKTYGRRAARRALHHSIGHSKFRELEYAQVHVLDRDQVHSRDIDHATNIFANARVVVVGVGSLGSTVAPLLARAGVGYLWLVDPEFLEDANLGRHALGTDDLGAFKSDALSKRLRGDVPTVEVTPITEFAQKAFTKYPGIFDQADLVISTTADWPCESALWTIKATGARWMLIQSWSEPHAQVGHALLAPTGQCDGRALFHASGQFRYRISEWTDEGIHALPGCGESFIPGGPSAMASIGAMVVRIALAALTRPPEEPMWHTTIGNIDEITAAGGIYTGPELPTGATQLSLARTWPEATNERP